MKFLKFLPSVMMLFLIGCALEKYPKASQVKTPDMPPLPALYRHHLPSAEQMSNLGELPETLKVRISWQNNPSEFATNYQTLVECSATLKDWKILESLPYEVAGSFTVTNGPPRMFFRVANTLK